MRSIEASLERLASHRIDILARARPRRRSPTAASAVGRPPDRPVHGPRAIGALVALRDRGRDPRLRRRHQPIGRPARCLAERGDFDLFLARRPLHAARAGGAGDLPAALRGRAASASCIGGPYNSGILATGARPGAFYDYEPAPPAILDRVARIEAVCDAHGVPLIAAALQFPLPPPGRRLGDPRAARVADQVARQPRASSPPRSRASLWARSSKGAGPAASRRPHAVTAGQPASRAP